MGRTGRKCNRLISLTFRGQEAQTFKIDNDSGLFNPDVLRQATLNQVIEDQLYPGIETEAEEQGAEPDEDDMETQLQREQLNQMKRGGFDGQRVGRSPQVQPRAAAGR